MGVGKGADVCGKIMLSMCKDIYSRRTGTEVYVLDFCVWSKTSYIYICTLSQCSSLKWMCGGHGDVYWGGGTILNRIYSKQGEMERMNET